MKTMTCKQLGGACDASFQGTTLDEIAALSQVHAQQMFQQQDVAHLQAMEKVTLMMQKPLAMQAWFELKKQEFDALPEDA